MGSDGAHLGVGAKDALSVILGGDDESEKVHETVEQMRDRILSITEEDANTYDGAATYTAKLILQWLMEDPTRAQTSVEADYDWEDDPDRGANGMKPEFTRAIGWYSQMKLDGVELKDLGLSGFQWGWACNAARRCLELPPVANPAIITVNTSERDT